MPFQQWVNCGSGVRSVQNISATYISAKCRLRYFHVHVSFTLLTYKYNITNKQDQLQVKQLLFATETYMALRAGHKHGLPWSVARGRQWEGMGGRWGPCSAGTSCGRGGRRRRGRVGFRAGSWIWVRSSETAPLVPLHVPHTSDRLDLWGGGLPVIPMLEISSLKNKLAPPVAWVHVTDPPARGETDKWSER